MLSMTWIVTKQRRCKGQTYFNSLIRPRNLRIGYHSIPNARAADNETAVVLFGTTCILPPPTTMTLGFSVSPPDPYFSGRSVTTGR